MSDPKKKSWLLKATIAGLVPVLYLASIGPATWLEARFETEDSSTVLDAAYRPVLWIASRCPESLQNGLRWYLSIGLPAGQDATFDEESIIRGTML